MQALIVEKMIEIPRVSTWKWTEEDFKTPLVFPLDGLTAQLFLTIPIHLGTRHETSFAKIQLKFCPVPKPLLKGLRSKTGSAVEVAEKIYAFYLDVADRFEGVARTAGKIKGLKDQPAMSLRNFLAFGITWWIDDQEPQIFAPRFKKQRHDMGPPYFKKNQSFTKEKWEKMQSAIYNHDFPSEEMLELLRIRSKLEWRQKKVATIESAILVETMLRTYGYQALQTLGLSATKIKSLKDELSFNLLLNIVFPFTLSKRELKKVDQHLKSVDLLRRIRNDVVHGNIKEEDIDEEKVRNGIEGSLVLVELLRKKLKP